MAIAIREAARKPTPKYINASIESGLNSSDPTLVDPCSIAALL
jgi:hypothetical protein